VIGLRGFSHHREVVCVFATRVGGMIEFFDIIRDAHAARTLLLTRGVVDSMVRMLPPEPQWTALWENRSPQSHPSDRVSRP